MSRSATTGSRTWTLSRPRASSSCARWSPSSSGRCCSSPAARTRSSCCGWPRRRSRRPASRSRSCTSTPGTTSPRCSTSATAGSTSSGVQLIVASVQEAIDSGLVREPRRRHAQPDPDAGAARRGREVPLRRAVRRRPPRRGEGPRQGAGLLLPRRVRPVGPEEPAARAVVALQRPASHPGESIRVFPLSNWTELDVWHYIARERHRAAGDLLRARARGGRARRHALRRQRVPAGCATGETSFAEHGALPHRRRRLAAPPRSAPTRTPSTR